MLSIYLLRWRQKTILTDIFYASKIARSRCDKKIYIYATTSARKIKFRYGYGRIIFFFKHL